MTKKRHYEVFVREVFEAEDSEDSFETEWAFIGDTWAVSEDKAVNNVRYRKLGCVSQYLPVATGGHWEKFIEWEAREAK